LRLKCTAGNKGIAASRAGVVIFGCGSLSASVSAGQASLGFCLLSFNL